MSITKKVRSMLDKNPQVTDRELFGLQPNYERATGLDQVTFEVPYELFKTLLKRTGQRLTHEEFLSITIHPTNRTKKTVGQCQFLFSIWMNDNLGEAIKPSILKRTELPRKTIQKSHLQKTGRKFRRRTLG